MGEDPVTSDRELELQETVLQLRSELRMEPHRQKVDVLQAAFGLSRHQALLLAALHDAGSSWMPMERLERVLPDRGDDPRSHNCVRVQLCEIRKRMGADDVILSMRDVGYTLGAPGVLACRRVLAAAAQVVHTPPTHL